MLKRNKSQTFIFMWFCIWIELVHCSYNYWVNYLFDLKTCEEDDAIEVFVKEMISGLSYDDQVCSQGWKCNMKNEITEMCCTVVVLSDSQNGSYIYMRSLMSTFIVGWQRFPQLNEPSLASNRLFSRNPIQQDVKQTNAYIPFRYHCIGIYQQVSRNRKLQYFQGSALN